MQWFDRWFLRMSKRAWEMAREQDENPPYAMGARSHKLVAVEDSRLSSRRKMNMALMPANGGSILEISWYDSKKDHHDNDLYIIDDDDELAPQLASILMQHKMRHG